MARKLLTLQTDDSLDSDIAKLKARTGLSKSGVIRLAVATLAGRGVVGLQWSDQTVTLPTESPEVA
jgi:hypothetical protein